MDYNDSTFFLSLLLNKFVRTSSFFISWSWILYVLTLCHLLFVWMTISMYDFLLHILNPLYLCWTQSIILWIQNFHNTNSISPAFSITIFELQFLYCKDDRDSAFSSSYVNMIGLLAKKLHSFKFIQNCSKILW